MINWQRCDAFHKQGDGLVRCNSPIRYLIILLIFDEAYPVRRCGVCAARLRANAAANGFEILFDERIDDE